MNQSGAITRMQKSSKLCSDDLNTRRTQTVLLASDLENEKNIFSDFFFTAERIQSIHYYNASAARGYIKGKVSISAVNTGDKKCWFRLCVCTIT